MTSPAASSPFPTVGAVLLDRFELVEELGRGGYSVVYAARDSKLDQEVAIKLLVPPPATAQTARERMRREAQAVRALSHPNIVRLYDYLEDGPWSFLVMERIDGDDLAERLKRDGPLPVDEVVKIGRGLASALAAAHDKGILHRDVKPQNVLLDSSGPRLVDFGSAKGIGQTMTRTGGFVGTIQYMAPELLVGKRPDARADVYALGVTLYMALTGTLPDGATAHSPPTSLDEGFDPCDRNDGIPRWLGEVVARATASRPESRFPTAAAMADALEKQIATPYGVGVGGRGSCLICGGPEPFGLSVCPSCGGVGSAESDTLVFVKPSMTAVEKRGVAQRLGRMLEGRAHSSEIDLLSGGHQALVKVPAGMAETVCRELALQGVPAITTRARTTWAHIPIKFYGMLALLAIVGTMATAGSTMPVWGAPVVASLLLIGAQQRLRLPVVRSPARRRTLPRELDDQIIRSLAELPRGSARNLLADLVRIAQPLHAAIGRAHSSPVPQADIERLLSSACGAARDLAQLEQGLSVLEGHVDESTDADRWLDGLALAERTRDGLVQKFLDGLTLLTRVRSDIARSSDEHRELVELLNDIEAHADAQHEVEALVAEVSAK